MDSKIEMYEEMSDDISTINEHVLFALLEIEKAKKECWNCSNDVVNGDTFFERLRGVEERLVNMSNMLYEEGNRIWEEHNRLLKEARDVRAD